MQLGRDTTSLSDQAWNWRYICVAPNTPCPINFAEEEERKCPRFDELERDAEEQLEASKAMLDLGPDGWMSHENHEGVQAATARRESMF